MQGAPFVLKVCFSQVPCFGPDNNQCILALSDSDEHVRIVKAFGALSGNALDILGWLHVLAAKPALIVPNYIMNDHLCTMYMFDLYRADYKPFIKALYKKNVMAAFNLSIGVTTEAELLKFLKELYFLRALSGVYTMRRMKNWPNAASICHTTCIAQ